MNHVWFAGCASFDIDWRSKKYLLGAEYKFVITKIENFDIDK